VVSVVVLATALVPVQEHPVQRLTLASANPAPRLFTTEPLILFGAEPVFRLLMRLVASLIRMLAALNVVPPVVQDEDI